MQNIDYIKKLLWHSYPFLLLDKILSVEFGKSSVALKNLTINEPFFQGHFSDYPLFPGVLMIEAMAQTSGLVFADPELDVEAFADKVPILIGANKVKFKKQARPGDQLIIKAVLKQQRGIFCIFDASLYVKDHEGDEQLGAAAEIRLAMKDFAELKAN